MLLDVNGIQFAVQLILLLTIGPYADYGSWRPWIMIVFQIIVYICTFTMCGISRPDQWEAALTLYTLGNIGRSACSL
jgi:MFS-type transporter involved in bile tolerance (Atg22 family)